MPAEQVAYYQQLKDHGQLEPPEIPALSIAWLALSAPRQFSGQFIDYDDPRISSKALEVFGENWSEVGMRNAEVGSGNAQIGMMV